MTPRKLILFCICAFCVTGFVFGQTPGSGQRPKRDRTFSSELQVYGIGTYILYEERSIDSEGNETGTPGDEAGPGFGAHVTLNMQSLKSDLIVNIWASYIGFALDVEKWRGSAPTSSEEESDPKSNNDLLTSAFMLGKRIMIQEHLPLDVYTGFGFSYWNRTYEYGTQQYAIYTTHLFIPYSAKLTILDTAYGPVDLGIQADLQLNLMSNTTINNQAFDEEATNSTQVVRDGVTVRVSVPFGIVLGAEQKERHFFGLKAMRFVPYFESRTIGHSDGSEWRRSKSTFGADVGLALTF